MSTSTSEPSGTTEGSNGARYWRSLDDLAETPGFRAWVETEFPEGAAELDGPGRRGFMKVMAASFGFAGLGFSGCRRPEQAIMPYGRQPEEVIPGVPNYYSSSLPSAYGNEPLVIESHQARPTKIDGNPSYAPYGGSTGVHAQASVLDLYDPDRSTKSQTRKSRNSNRWNALGKAKQSSLVAECATAVSSASGNAKVAFWATKSSSPTRAKLAAALQKNPNVIWVEREAIDFGGPETALGKHFETEDTPIRPVHHLAKAKRIFSLDADFLGLEPDHLRCTRDFSKGRTVDSHEDALGMNRLYAVEANLTLTGSMADHRLRLGASEIPAFAYLLAAEVLAQAKAAPDELTKQLRSRGKSLQVDSAWISEAAKDLVEHARKSEAVVMAGSHLPEQTHVLAFAMNQALQAIGTTVEYVEVAAPSSTTISDLTAELEKGSVKTLIFVGGNPGYDDHRDWSTLLKGVDKVVRFGYSMDETSELADVHLASTHYLESWSDGFSWARDALFPVQPLIDPLFAGISELDLLSQLIGGKKNAYSLVKATFAELSGNDDFNDFLREGSLPLAPNTPSVKLDYSTLSDLPELPQGKTLSAENLDLTLTPSFNAWDGRYANNGWMQECPDPLTKLTWDNAILISPRLAKELQETSGVSILPEATMLNEKGVVATDTAILDLGKESAPIAKLKVGDRVIEGPLHVQPGLANYSIVASLGYGRRVVGRVGEGAGFDAYPLLSDGQRVLAGATLELTSTTYEVSYLDDHHHTHGHVHKIDASTKEDAIREFKTEEGEKDFKVSAVEKSTKPLGRHKLANVQEHWSLEGRAIIREGTAEHYHEKPDFAAHMGMESHTPPVYGKDKEMALGNKARQTPRGASSYEHPDHKYEGSEDFGVHQWGMTIDLNRCTGCSACTVACQSENNVSIVGKDQVLRGREMHWIRMDRYFSSVEREGADLPEDVQVSFQGMACAQCETAPCESVCPVNATVHDEEGLNAMAYNRCVGTRYCANNCPYKVRRFNFFDWNKRAIGEFYKGPLGDKNDPLPSLQKNPDVTVRMRGVMEKCTYCVQRIQEAKIRTKANAQRSKQLATGKHGADLKLEEADLKVPDGTIKTACQQVCPAEAIEFGDISDENSAVSKLKSADRNYSVLGYLEIRPRTTYLAKLRNPNPKMPDKYAAPYTAEEYDRRAHGGSHDHGHNGNGTSEKH